ncbi:MAG: cellulose synthase subunit BcsC-related outer membrane protein, partial [Terracidiphilus sp.]
ATAQASNAPLFLARRTAYYARTAPAPIRLSYEPAHFRDATFHPQEAGGHYVLAVDQTTLGHAQLPDHANTRSGDLSARAPHSLASDAWKGLVFSLMAAGRDQEAIQEIAKIPPDIRGILDTDLDFVQGEASLYIAVGDLPHAFEYLNEVENYYSVRGGVPPVGLEVQHAWLLYNTRNDRDLYPLLMRLDARLDLSAAEREQVDNLWADWAVRRAEAALNSGDTARGVELLDAASEDYPNNVAVRTAVAGVYAKLGRADDAVALFKTIPLATGGPGDFAAAISAALAANDITQAQTWLNQALARFPGNPSILESAARFEQVRGDNVRASAYWRAAIAAMPPGASVVPSLNSTLGNPPGTWSEPAPGETRRLLNPANDEQTALPPLPGTPAAAQQTAPGDLPLFVPPAAKQQGANQPVANQPVFVEQSATRPAVMRSAVNTTRACAISSSGASECSHATTGTPIPNVTSQASAPPEALRISSQPMSRMAAEIAALFAQQTDGQLTQGFAGEIHAAPAAASDQTAPGVDSAAPRLLLAQYTPSAQEAATGAYSSPRSQTAQPGQLPPVAQTPPTTAPVKRRRRRRRRRTAPAESTPAQSATPTLGNAAPAVPNPQEGPIPDEAPAAAPSTTNSGLTDQELEQRNLPPLTGPWVRVQREPRTLSPRDLAEMQLESIESGYSGWLGGAGLLNYRSGNLGYDHLSALEAPFEASFPLGVGGRFTVIAKPVFLDSGQATGNAVITVDESTTGGTTITSIPEPIGTDTNTSGSSTAGGGIPPQQNAAGIAGEAQLAFPHLAIAGGYTPAGFLVATFTARAYWRPANGPFTFSFDRDSETDSQLSYSGLRDPAGNSLGTLGAVWGGVVYNYGRVQYSRGTAQSGYYIGAGGQYLTGYNVESNNRIEGMGGAYWHIYTAPEYGNLSIGANFFGMHYANNQDAFTYGMGGYFSPQAYFLANIPFTWVGHYQTRWHYNVVGGLGVQAFQNDQTPLWPLAGQKAIEAAQNNPMLPAMTSVGPNYDLRAQTAYQISPHWFAGGFFGANNTRNYSEASVGFYVRFLFRAQPSTVTAPTGIFPMDGLRPFTVP